MGNEEEACSRLPVIRVPDTEHHRPITVTAPFEASQSSSLHTHSNPPYTPFPSLRGAGPFIPIDWDYEGSPMTDNLAHSHNRHQVVITIDELSDDDLLAIFDFYVVIYQDLGSGNPYTKRETESWQSLVHVCRRWRGLVFGSPRRLNLRLIYLPSSLAKSLHVWPALPLLIHGIVPGKSMDNVIAELEHNDRICDIDLICNTTSLCDRLWTAMQVPFPELTSLNMSSEDSSCVPVLPDSFLGGSVPRLRHFALDAIPFPGLPKSLLSATHLVHLWLFNIPHSGYISPEAMVTFISTLTSLETLQLESKSPRSFPEHESQHSPPPTRSVLPALTIFWFKGVNEYLVELVARVDTPRLLQLSATFFNDIDFDTSELIRLVSNTSTLKAPIEVHVFFDSQTASVKLRPPQVPNDEYFSVKILCREPGWQLSSLAQICTTSLPLLSTTENLFIREYMALQLDWKVGIENIEWLELLLPFTAVKNLYISKQFAPRVAPALKETTEDGTIEVLPALQNIYLEGFESSGSIEDDIEGFISARRLSGHPVAIFVWDRNLVRGS